MKTTANFKLKKPDLTDVADIEVLNSNSDILDKIIKDLQNAQFTEQQARQIFALISHRHNTSDINNLTTAIQQTKVNSAAYADNAGRANNAINADKLKNMIFHWSGQGGQPPWLWGGSDGTNMYVYNPSNFNVNHANTAGSANSVQGFQFRNNNGQLEVLMNGVWLSVGTKQYTVSRLFNSIDSNTNTIQGQRVIFDYSGGSGIIRNLSWYSSSDHADNTLILTVDGKEFELSTAGWSQTQKTDVIYIPTNNNRKFWDYSTSFRLYELPCEIEFKNSLKIQFKYSSSRINGYYGLVQTEK